MAAKKKAAPAPDAIKLLKSDHDTVRELLGQFENATGARREKLRVKIDRELKVHTQIEEEIFYPAYHEAARKKEDQKLYYEALQEHHVVDLVLPEVNDGESNEELKAKAKVLKELVEHHADEEEKEMFPRAKKLLDKNELRALGEQMQLRKETLMAANA
ncbi:MAG TPA: hemerythrin domain-containing protein [Thermoanaerobaculia bacterium]|jgi:hemerythrin-like domain-containing protein|nr:hemerythrin domain-containing protein [Thermoanaerobaculia bacterium]